MALFEGIARTGSATVVAFIGLSFMSMSAFAVSTFIIGAVQAGGAGLLLLFMRRNFWRGRNFLFLSVMLGIFGTILTVLMFIILGTYHGDLAVYTFVAVGLSVVPGALIDRIFFGTRFTVYGWFGVMVAVFGGYVILGFPAFENIRAFPLWVFLSAFSACIYAVNRGLTRKLMELPGVQDFDGALVQNVWTGLATVTACAVLFSVVPSSLSYSGTLFGGSIFVGTLVFLLVSSSYMAFARGANIAAKETVSIGTFLFLSAVSGAAVLGGKFGLEHILGIVLYMLAFLLIQRGRRIDG